jgi:hypothetical protein
MAGNWDILIEQGADWRPVPPRWMNDDRVTPIALSSYSGHMQIRTDFGVDVVAADLSTTNGKMILGDDGRISLVLTAIETAAFQLDLSQISAIKRSLQVVLFGYYDLRLVSATGFVTKLLSGAVWVAPGITSGV